MKHRHSYVLLPDQTVSLIGQRHAGANPNATNMYNMYNIVIYQNQQLFVSAVQRTNIPAEKDCCTIEFRVYNDIVTGPI